MKIAILTLMLGLFIIHNVKSQPVNGVIVSDSNNIMVIKLWGTSQERGFAYGYLTGDKMSEVFEGFVRPFYGSNYAAMRELIIEGTSFTIDSVYQAEAQAVVDGMNAAGLNFYGYDYVDVLAGNMFNDMYDWPFGKFKAGQFCSTFMNWGEATSGTDLDGCSVISRHLDTPYVPECLKNNCVIVSHIPSEEGQQPWLMIDYAGAIATTSGLNHSGYSLFQNGMGISWDPQINAGYQPVRFLIRSILETTDYNLDGTYDLKDIRDAISSNELGFATGKIFSALGPSAAGEDSLIALVAEVAPEEPYITFRTNSYNDSLPGDNLYAANSEIARNNSHNYCYRYKNMIEHIGDGDSIGSQENWELMRDYSNGGTGNLIFLQYIPEWDLLKVSNYTGDSAAYMLDPNVFDLNELFSLPVNVHENKGDDLQLELFPNPSSEILVIRYNIPAGLISSTFDKTYRLAIVDISGKVIRVLEGDVNHSWNSIQIDVSTLSKGIYSLSLQSEGQRAVKKFILQ